MINIEESKKQIDTMSRLEIVYLWRFAPSGHPFFQPPLGEYIEKRFKELSGFSPKISKTIG